MARVFDLYKVGLKYPELTMRIMNYFSPQFKGNNGESIPSKDKSIVKFCNLFYKGEHGEYVLNGFDVVKICEILFEKNMLMKTRSDGSTGLFNNYICNMLNLEDTPMWKNLLNSVVFGFDYIYEKNKDMVVPVVYDCGDGDYAAGTAFKFMNGIATAKHCLTDVKNLMIKGFSAEELNHCHVYIHENDGVDVAFIDLGKILNIDVFPEEGKVLDDVLVMGYPKIPAFTDLITAEKTSIAAKADARQTTTKGAIVSYGEQYLMRCNMMLITAKISGGNSGGPVINEKGSLVGIVSSLTDAEGDYDNLGYGVVSPVEYLMDIVPVNGKRKEMNLPGSFFKDWIW